MTMMGAERCRGRTRRRPSHLIAFSLYIFSIFGSASAFVSPFRNHRLPCSRSANRIWLEYGTIDFERGRRREETLKLREVDVLYSKETTLAYDPTLDRYVPVEKRRRPSDHPHHVLDSLRQSLKSRLAVAFLPSGVTENYFRFMQWRVMQRFISANLNVLGTQSLLLGLGIKSRASQLGALSAALQWVLKDVLGKMVRMVWASNMGRRFDSDARRWRFRSSLVFALGNGLEIATFIFPQLFLLVATLANCCKQISFLTSSSTRTAIYNSFRDGTRENIGDITAKGEAQIAIVDLLGIASGVAMSRAIGTSVPRVLALYFCLQAAEILCMYRQLRNVEYRVLNFERMIGVMYDFVSGAGIQTPKETAKNERIFLPPRRLARRGMAFGSLGRAKLSPDELEQLMNLFQKERFLLVVGANVKHPLQRRWLSKPDADDARKRRENCHIVLHEEANNVDIVKSTLALTLLRRKLAVASQLDPDTMRSSDCMDLIQSAYEECNQLFSPFLREMNQQGWESPARFMFGRVHMRADWPLQSSKNSNNGGSSR